MTRCNATMSLYTAVLLALASGEAATTDSSTTKAFRRLQKSGERVEEQSTSTIQGVNLVLSLRGADFKTNTINPDL